jgi:metal-responsive CopG/Arc/MetJ family transcriptional regulator
VGYTHGIKKGITTSPKVVKTAISLEWDLFERGEATAHRMGLSRSGLFATALKEFLERRDNEQLARDLDEAYSGGLDDQEREQLRAASESFQRLLDRDR